MGLRGAASASYPTAAMPWLQARVRIAPAGLSAAPIAALTFVPGRKSPRPGDDSEPDRLLTLGGQPSDEPQMLALVPLPQARSLVSLLTVGETIVQWMQLVCCCL